MRILRCSALPLGRALAATPRMVSCESCGHLLLRCMSKLHYAPNTKMPACCVPTSEAMYCRSIEVLAFIWLFDGATCAAVQVGDLIESAKVVDGGNYLQSPSDN